MRYTFAAIACFVAIAAGTAGVRLHSKGWTHVVSGLPHFPQACDVRSHPILVLGQSQASNTGPLRDNSVIQAFALEEGSCYHLRDPMPGTGGRGGSIWPRFANSLNQPVTITNLAISGSSIEEWTNPRQIKKIQHALKGFKDKGFSSPTIIWMQGETNAARHDTSEHYELELRKLMSIAPYNQWIITRESICRPISLPSAALNQARDRVAKRFPRVVFGPNLDTIPLSQRQPDRCHMTSANQELIAQQLADTFRHLQPSIPTRTPTGFARLGL